MQNLDKIEKKAKNGHESKRPMVEDAETWRGVAIDDEDDDKLRLGVLRKV